MEAGALSKGQRPIRKGSLYRYLIIIAALAAALWYGRSRSGPDLVPHMREIFPRAAAFEPSNGIYAVFSEQDTLLGWVASGRASGYGGPLLVVVGIDMSGEVAGARVVEHKETPLFFRMVRASAFFGAITGRSFAGIDYDYGEVVGVTGATRSSEAIVAGVKDAIRRVAGDKFDIYLPAPQYPFEFGILEIAIILMFAVGIASSYFTDSLRELLRWTSQVTGLVIIGFWKNSPITIAKIVSLLSGYLPDIRSNLSLYLLIVGFVLTILIMGRSVYCTHICPFGAAQQLINLIGGKNVRLPAWSVRLMNATRNLIVFAAVLAALAVARPALASYEPFAALFALRGTILQWVLLLVVLLSSLAIRRPWCNFFCPVQTCRRVLQGIRRKGADLPEASYCE